MPASQKKHMRLLMKEKRKSLFHKHPDAGEKVARQFFEHFDLSSPSVVGGYWPIGCELDIRPLLYALIKKGFKCVLPCLTPEGLTFRRWTPSLSLEKKTFHVYEPPETEPILVPDLVLVPFLAFDKRGHRLGYGQGHYDQFLHQYPVKAIGVGFREQEVSHIPHQAHDFALDAILTEEGVILPTFKGSS